MFQFQNDILRRYNDSDEDEEDYDYEDGSFPFPSLRLQNFR